ncbi:hypothetical protein KPATCC21470_0184 [Kitasatospora purpeofusca]
MVRRTRAERRRSRLLLAMGVHRHSLASALGNPPPDSDGP